MLYFVLILEILVFIVFLSNIIKNNKIIEIKNVYLYPLIVFIGVILYTRGNNDGTFWCRFLTSFEYSLKSIGLNFEFSIVESYAQSNKLYFSEILILYLFEILSFIKMAFEFFIGFVNNHILISLTKHKDHIVVIGYNEKSKIFLKNSKNCLLLTNNLNKEEKSELIKNRIPYIIKQYDNKVLEKVCNSKRTVNVVCFIEDESMVVDIAQKMIALLDKKDEKTKTIIDNITVHIPLKDSSKSIARQIERASKGRVIQYNLHKINSMKFIKNNCFAKYFSGDFVDKKLALCCENARINLTMVGFGNLNKCLLPSVFANNQFVRYTNNTYEEVPYCVNIFDKSKITDANVKKNIYNYSAKNFVSGKYFDAPFKDLKINIFESVDIGSSLFYNQIKTNLNKNYNNFNVYFIALGDDADNLNLAINLRDFLKQNDIPFNKIFVSIKYLENLQYLIDKNIMNDIKIFGAYSTLLSEKNIIDSENKNFAKARAKEYAKNKDEKSWFVLSRLKQLSNVYSEININNKTAICGLDNENTKLSSIVKQDYLSALIKQSNYKFDFYGNSIRDNLARMEHIRWCAFEIANGVLPMERKKVKVELQDNFLNGKTLKCINQNEEYLQHACITSLDGLKDYHIQIIEYAKKYYGNVFSEKEIIEQLDTVQYDYQSMDMYVNRFEKGGVI